MSGTAIPQSDGALLAAQAKAGQAGLDAYEAAKAEMSSNRNNAISGALSAAESRGAPNAAMQSTLAGAEQVYDQRQASLTGAEAAYKDAMASRSQRAQDYQGAIQGARGLIADQAVQAVAPIRAQSEFQINQLRQSGENRVSEIGANQALNMSRMTAEQAARQQQYDLDLARYQEEKGLELERYQEQMRLEAERFERQFQASYSGGSGSGSGSGSDTDDREQITTQGDLQAVLDYAALSGLTESQAFAIISQKDSITAYDKRKELMDARSGGRLKPGFVQSQTMNPQAPRPVVPPMPSFETPSVPRSSVQQTPQSTPFVPQSSVQPQGKTKEQYLREAYESLGEQYLQGKQYDQRRLDELRTDFDDRISNSEYSDLMGTVPEFDFDDPSGAGNAFSYDVSALQRAYEIELPGLRENFDFKDSSFINAMSDGNYENPNDIISRSEGRGDTASQTVEYERFLAEQQKIFDEGVANRETQRVIENENRQKTETKAAEEQTNADVMNFARLMGGKTPGDLGFETTAQAVEWLIDDEWEIAVNEAKAIAADVRGRDKPRGNSGRPGNSNTDLVRELIAAGINPYAADMELASGYRMVWEILGVNY
tara:strand:+ start:825 stop:2624 length:1800 start_codon:yes stop_codon:yes gene_type:complete